MTNEEMKQIVEEAVRAVEKSGLKHGFIEWKTVLPEEFPPRRGEAITWRIDLILCHGSLGGHFITVTETNESTHNSIKQDIINTIEAKLDGWKALCS